MDFSNKVINGVLIGAFLATVTYDVAAQSLSAPLKVRFAPEKDYGPFVYQDPNGHVKGLSVDILASVSRVGGLQIDTQPARNLAQILQLARQGEVDLVSSLRPTVERARFLGFSRPYVSVPAVLVRRAGDRSKRTLAELAGQAVAVGKGYAVEEYLREKHPAVHWVAVTDDTAALRALLAGEVEGVVADVASVAFAVREHGMNGLQIHGPVGFEYALSFAYPAARTEIGEALERGLRDLRSDERDTIVKRWIDVDAIRFHDARADTAKTIAGVAGALAVAIAGVAIVRRKPVVQPG